MVKAQINSSFEFWILFSSLFFVVESFTKLETSIAVRFVELLARRRRRLHISSGMGHVSVVLIVKGICRCLR